MIGGRACSRCASLRPFTNVLSRTCALYAKRAERRVFIVSLCVPIVELCVEVRFQLHLF